MSGKICFYLLSISLQLRHMEVNASPATRMFVPKLVSQKWTIHESTSFCNPFEWNPPVTNGFLPHNEPKVQEVLSFRYIIIMIVHYVLSWSKRQKRCRPHHTSSSEDIFPTGKIGNLVIYHYKAILARFTGQTWGPCVADRTQVGPMLVPWFLPSVYCVWRCFIRNSRIRSSP